MLLKHKEMGTLIEIHDIESLINPAVDKVEGQDQAGQEEQDPTPFVKTNLTFPSGEELPRCWLDANYKNA
jgi:hypothetical protein